MHNDRLKNYTRRARTKKPTILHYVGFFEKRATAANAAGATAQRMCGDTGKKGRTLVSAEVARCFPRDFGGLDLSQDFYTATQCAWRNRRARCVLFFGEGKKNFYMLLRWHTVINALVLANGAGVKGTVLRAFYASDQNHPSRINCRMLLGCGQGGRLAKPPIARELSAHARVLRAYLPTPCLMDGRNYQTGRFFGGLVAALVLPPPISRTKKTHTFHSLRMTGWFGFLP